MHLKKALCTEMVHVALELCDTFLFTEMVITIQQAPVVQEVLDGSGAGMNDKVCLQHKSVLLWR
jgi:hypothetical protein